MVETLLVVAVFTVAGGAFWAGYYHGRLKEMAERDDRIGR